MEPLSFHCYYGDISFRLTYKSSSLINKKYQFIAKLNWPMLSSVSVQVVTIAVYSFFAFCVIGRQFLDPKKEHKDHRIDMYIPVFTLLQFFFYAGWLKVWDILVFYFYKTDHLLFIMTFLLQSAGWRADHQPVWRGRRWFWNQPADWPEHSGCPLFPLLTMAGNTRVLSVLVLICLLSPEGVHACCGWYVPEPGSNGERQTLGAETFLHTLHSVHSSWDPQTSFQGLHLWHEVNQFYLDKGCFCFCKDQRNHNHCNDSSLKCHMPYLQDERRGPWDPRAPRHSWKCPVFTYEWITGQWSMQHFADWQWDPSS